ncbi:MAG: bifunctional 2-polyprenyl-6-hydroxyphenol methylase/3-demethylubiquinol 3-O-methyltransferase UbiG [Azospirillaceae bacterium]
MSAQTRPAAAPADATVDRDEIDRFDRIAAEWWAPDGQFRPLHRMNPVRLGYIRDQVLRWRGMDDATARPLQGLEVLDVGCGGGLLAEPLARLGGRVTGVDASEKAIGAARAHAAARGLAIDYRAEPAEALVEAGLDFDVVTALEVVEHVADVGLFLGTLGRLVRPGGLVFLSTLNRTPQSLAKAIVGAEYLLRWVPRGTHDWRKFLKPSELGAHLRAAGLDVVDVTGMVYAPFAGTWSLDHRDLSVNYIMTASLR